MTVRMQNIFITTYFYFLTTNIQLIVMLTKQTADMLYFFMI